MASMLVSEASPVQCDYDPDWQMRRMGQPLEMTDEELHKSVIHGAIRVKRVVSQASNPTAIGDGLSYITVVAGMAHQHHDSFIKVDGKWVWKWCECDQH